MRYALFLGCTVPARARNYEMSARKVAEKVGMELVDLPDFACCGFPLKSIDRDAFLLMAARNLCLAEEASLNICALCSACGEVLTEVNRELKEDPQKRNRVNEKLRELGREYKGTIEIKHFVRVLYEDIGPEKIRQMVVRDLKPLKFAPHYGCHYVKPSHIYNGFDEHEYPQSLDRLIDATGASPVSYEDKMQCCGGAVLAVDEKVALSMAKLKLDHIKAAGADGITLMCPFCSVMYDDNQRKVEGTFQVSYQLPVLYYPQVLGLALGFDPRDLGLNMNRVRTKDLVEKVVEAS
ncbi:MAG: CoB--CoM heterodisulfide reductase iron-sulfur subunit B family protein [bacterium]